MNSKRIQTVFIITASIYFLLFIFPNNTGADTKNMISVFEPDEFAQYPYLIHMLEFHGNTFRQKLWHIFAYQHYYYGFPFYLFSFLVLLPVKLLNGLDNVQLNMLVLRQFVSVLPMIISLLLLVNMQSKRWNWKAFGLFFFLITTPIVVRNNLWWHPDSLAILFCVLTLFFLDRDNMEYSNNYYFAAVTTGMAIGTKMLGWFFFLTIPVYLLMGVKAKKITWVQTLKRATFFLVIMLVTVFFSNPALIHPVERARYIAIQKAQSSAMRSGWAVFYPRGLSSWYPIISEYYLFPITLVVLGFAVIVGLRDNKYRLRTILILTWVMPMLVYILFFVAIKPKHLLMPVALPLLSCFWFLFSKRASNEVGSRKQWVLGLATLILMVQTGVNTLWDVQHYRGVYLREEQHPALEFYGQLERDVLECLPEDSRLLAYRDTRIYLPENPQLEVIMSWETIDYGFIQEYDPEIIVLQTQKIADYTKADLFDVALDKEKMRKTYEFYSDAKNRMIVNYRLLFDDDFGLAFLRNDMVDQITCSAQ